MVCAVGVGASRESNTSAKWHNRDRESNEEDDPRCGDRCSTHHSIVRRTVHGRTSLGGALRRGSPEYGSRREHLDVGGGRWTTVFAWLLLGVSALLLVSFGGAIFAAPLTLPLLVLAARREAGAFRLLAGIVGVLTTAEVVWAIAYFTAGEDSALIWFAPLASVIVAIAAFFKLASSHGSDPATR